METVQGNKIGSQKHFFFLAYFWFPCKCLHCSWAMFSSFKWHFSFSMRFGDSFHIVSHPFNITFVKSITICIKRPTSFKLVLSGFWVTIPLNLNQLLYHRQESDRKSIVKSELGNGFKSCINIISWKRYVVIWQVIITHGSFSHWNNENTTLLFGLVFLLRQVRFSQTSSVRDHEVVSYPRCPGQPFG